MNSFIRKTFLFVGVFLCASLGTFAQSDGADWIKGTWITESGKTKVYVYKAKNGKYYGKVVWLKSPNGEDGEPLKDIHNPDESKRDQPIMDMLIFKGFEYDADDDEWINGTLYKYDEGDTYSGYMSRNDDGTLNLKGYILGMRFLGKSSTWSRVD